MRYAINGDFLTDFLKVENMISHIYIYIISYLTVIDGYKYII